MTNLIQKLNITPKRLALVFFSGMLAMGSYSCGFRQGQEDMSKRVTAVVEETINKYHTEETGNEFGTEYNLGGTK